MNSVTESQGKDSKYDVIIVWDPQQNFSQKEAEAILSTVTDTKVRKYLVNLINKPSRISIAKKNISFKKAGEVTAMFKNDLQSYPEIRESGIIIKIVESTKTQRKQIKRKIKSLLEEHKLLLKLVKKLRTSINSGEAIISNMQ